MGSGLTRRGWRDPDESGIMAGLRLMCRLHTAWQDQLLAGDGGLGLRAGIGDRWCRPVRLATTVTVGRFRCGRESSCATDMLVATVLNSPGADSGAGSQGGKAMTEAGLHGGSIRGCRCNGVHCRQRKGGERGLCDEMRFVGDQLRIGGAVATALAAQ